MPTPPRTPAEVKAYARTMTPADPPLFLYIDGPMPESHSTCKIKLTLFDGDVIGKGRMRRGGKRENQMYVTATIGDRKFWGKTPTRNGTYVRLRPYVERSK